MFRLSIYVSDEDLAYWDEHKVEVCSHVRDRNRVGYCLGLLCRPCIWLKAGVNPEKIRAYEEWEDTH